MTQTHSHRHRDVFPDLETSIRVIATINGHKKLSWLLSTSSGSSLKQNLGRKGLTDVSQILTRPGRDMGLLYVKRNPVDIFCRLSTMHERDRKTERPRNGNIDGRVKLLVSDVA